METQNRIDEEFQLMNKKRKRYFRIALVCAILALAMPIILTQKELCIIPLGEPKDIGSIIGGIATPFLTLIAIWLTFEAFWVQYESNQNQIKISQEQKKY